MKIIKKVIDNGIVWGLSRIIQEINQPSFKSMRWLMNGFYAIKSVLFEFGKKTKRGKNSRLIAIYDTTAGGAVTYDFAFFLASAEAFGLKHGVSSFSVCIIKKDISATGFGLYSTIVDSYSSMWRLEQIVVPLINLYPACISYTVLPLSERSNIGDLIKEQIVFPRFYNGRFRPNLEYSQMYSLLNEDRFTGFLAPKQGGRYIKLWMEQNKLIKPIVTIVLRNYGYDSSRNSNVDEWIKFAEWVSNEGFIPVFVPDTDTSFIEDVRFDGFVVFREVCWNMGLRMALYEKAYLNFISAGPATIAVLSRTVRYIVRYAIVEDSLLATKKIYESMDMPIGQKKYTFSRKNQLLSWQEDVFENIHQEFCDFQSSEEV